MWLYDDEWRLDHDMRCPPDAAVHSDEAQLTRDLTSGIPELVAKARTQKED